MEATNVVQSEHVWSIDEHAEGVAVAHPIKLKTATTPTSQTMLLEDTFQRYENVSCHDWTGNNRGIYIHRSTIDRSIVIFAIIDFFVQVTSLNPDSPGYIMIMMMSHQ